MLVITANEDGTYAVEITDPYLEQLNKCCDILQLPEQTILAFIFATGMKVITDLIYP